jgi:hypothetical protein
MIIIIVTTVETSNLTSFILVFFDPLSKFSDAFCFNLEGPLLSTSSDYVIHNNVILSRVKCTIYETLLNDLRDKHSRWQCPRGLRHQLSSPAWTLGSWVRIPLEAWMSVCAFILFVLSCVQVTALRRADPPSKESYRLCIGLRNWKSGQGPTEGL